MELTEQESLYKILRSHEIKNLKFSDKITSRLNEKFNNIGDIYDAEIDDIRMNTFKTLERKRLKMPL